MARPAAVDQSRATGQAAAFYADWRAFILALDGQRGAKATERVNEIRNRALAHPCVAVDDDRGLGEGEGCREEADGRAGVSAVEGVGGGFELAAAAGDEPVFEATGAGGFGAQADAHGFEGLAHYDCVVGV